MVMHEMISLKGAFLLQQKQGAHGHSCTGFKPSWCPEEGNQRQAPLLCGCTEGRDALKSDPRMAVSLQRLSKGLCCGPRGRLVWSLLARAADLKNVPSHLPAPGQPDRLRLQGAAQRVELREDV